MLECPTGRMGGSPFLGDAQPVPDEIEGIACWSAHHPGRMGGSPFLGRRTAAFRMRLRELRAGVLTTPEEWAGAILGETHSRVPDEIEGIASPVLVFCIGGIV